jgi:putative effector of murein hydrolase
MIDKLAGLLGHLENISLTWLLITVAAYRLALLAYAKSRFHPLSHPVGVSVALLVAILTVTGTPYQTYFSGTQLIHLLLGPATVALAIPLWQHAAAIKQRWFTILVAAIAGSVVCVVSAMAIAWSMGASDVTILALGAKSVTMPIAMGMAEKLNGSQSLTSALVLLTGMVGAILTQPLLKSLRLTGAMTHGFALGVSAHGIGVSKAFGIGLQEGAYASLAMGLCGVFTALFLPLVYLLIH